MAAMYKAAPVSPGAPGGDYPGDDARLCGPTRACGPGAAVIQAMGPSCEECGAPTLDCECNVLGASTFNTNQGSGLGLGLGPGATGRLNVDAGDACRWQAKWLLLVAFRASNTENLLANPIERLPFVLLNARVGNISQIRRNGVNNLSFGIITDGYSDNKDLTCVDWASFTSTNNQGLTLDIYNPNDVAIHAFADLWGRVIA